MSLQESYKILPRLGHDHYVFYTLQFIVHLTPYHSMLENVATESVIEKPQRLCPGIVNALTRKNEQNAVSSKSVKS